MSVFRMGLATTIARADRGTGPTPRNRSGHGNRGAIHSGLTAVATGSDANDQNAHSKAVVEL